MLIFKTNERQSFIDAHIFTIKKVPNEYFHLPKKIFLLPLHNINVVGVSQNHINFDDVMGLILKTSVKSFSLDVNVKYFSQDLMTNAYNILSYTIEIFSRFPTRFKLFFS